MAVNYFQRGALKIAYQDDGQGKAVVFLHGLGANSTSWDFQAKFFGDDYRVIRPDFRGFGLSSKPHERDAYSIKLFAEDVSLLLQHLDVEKAIVVGTSMGGYVAQTIALEQPETVVKLVLCHTACSRRVPEQIMTERLTALANLNMADYAKLAVTRALAPDGDDAVKQRVVEMIAANDHAAYSIIFGEGALDFDLCARLTELEVPCWVITSEQDQVAPNERSWELQQKIAGSTLLTVSDSGHLSYLENPTEFNRYLQQVLSA